MCVPCVSVFLEDTVCPLGAPLLPAFRGGGKAAPQMICTIPVQLPFPIVPSSGNPNSASSGKKNKGSVWVRRVSRRRPDVSVSAVLAVAPEVAHTRAGT